MTGPEDGYVLAVDLGTSHTVAMLRRPDGRTRPLLFDGQPLLPSAVHLDAERRLHVGRDAQRLGHADPARIEPNPKRRIDDDGVLLGDQTVAVPDLLAALLGAVAREAVATAGHLPPAVLTYPAAWGERRRAVLTESLVRAGWPATTTLLPEPVAAARYFAEVLRRPVPVGSALAVFDFGGGTLDVAVVRNPGHGHSRFEVAASGGADDLGGLDLDAALVDHLGATLSRTEPEAWAALSDPRTLAQWRARRQFWEDVRGAKEMLSRSAIAPVPVPGVEQAVHLTRDELEAAAGPLIRRGVAEAAEVIEAAGLTPGELAGLFLVGGSSRVPLVARLLHHDLGIAPTVLEQPELPVAEGAIIAALPAAPAASSAASSAAGPLGAAPGLGGVLAAGTAAGPAAGVPGPPAAGAGQEDSGTSASHPPARCDADVPLGVGAADRETGAAGSQTEAVGAGGQENQLPATAAMAADDGLTYHRGVAEAATPTPTPPTVPRQPPPDRVPGQRAGEGASGYAEPVDPWATGEAAAFGPNGAPHYGGATPTSGAAPIRGAEPATAPHQPWLASAEQGQAAVPAYRKKWVLILAAALVVVVGAGVSLAVALWPGYRAIDFESLDRNAPVTLEPAVPFGLNFTGTRIIGDRVYYATEEDTGVLGVVAADATTGEKLWSSTAAKVAVGWEQMIALPDGLAVFTEVDSGSDTRRLAVLDAEDGKLRWERTINRADGVVFTGDVAVWLDRGGKRLRGLRLSNGEIKWEREDPASDSGTPTAVFAASTPRDVSGPAQDTGTAFAPERNDDTRLLQVMGDESARVLDGATGEVLVQPKAGITGPNGEVVVHNGRVVVLEKTSSTQRLLAYDLDDLAGPRVVGQIDIKRGVEHLTPCGDDLVCWVEEESYNAETAHVAGANVAEPGPIWRVAQPGTEVLVPVGDHVLAGSKKATLIDAKTGKPAWSEDGVAVRLDGGNVLLFSRPLTTSEDDPSLSGRHLGDKPVQLGPLRGVRSASCSWNTSVIACVGEKNLIWQRFAA